MECDVCKDKNREIFKCDGCKLGICKTCAGLTSSEVKVLQLNSRVMIFHCKKCLSFETNMLLTNTIEDKNMIISNKDEIIALLKKKIEDLENSQQSFVSPPLLGMSYSKALTNTNEPIQKKQSYSNSPSLIIKPKQNQSIDKMKADLKQKINPTELKIAIRGTRNTANGHLVVKCQSKQDLDTLKDEADKILTGYEIDIPKLRKPRIKITGYNGDLDRARLEECIKEQNQFINTNDELKITFVKEMKDFCTVFGECSPSLFHKFMTVRKVFIGWERYPVYEDIGVTRCFKCQEPYHKSNNCPNQPSCERCAGQHDTSKCNNSTQKQCTNCKIANGKYGLKYKTDHRASDPECQSYQYLVSILRGKTDYGSTNG